MTNLSRMVPPRPYGNTGQSRLSKGEGAITKKLAEIERDKFLAQLNAATVDAAVEKVATTGVALFGGCQNVRGRLPGTRKLSLNQIQAKAVGDWLHTTFDSWWTMHGVRAIMSRIFYYAEGHGLWEEGKRSPASQAKLGKKHHTYERKTSLLTRPHG